MSNADLLQGGLNKFNSSNVFTQSSEKQQNWDVSLQRQIKTWKNPRNSTKPGRNSSKFQNSNMWSESFKWAGRTTPENNNQIRKSTKFLKLELNITKDMLQEVGLHSMHSTARNHFKAAKDYATLQQILNVSVTLNFNQWA